MMTLKDIKVSKSYIPVQNAIWLRPLGGLKFKLYYPRGGNWSEVHLTGGGSSSSGGSSSNPRPARGTAGGNTGSNVIVAKAICKNSQPGYKYFFADGQIKIKWDGDVYAYSAFTGDFVFKHDKGTIRKSIDLRSWLHRPYLITILTEEEYNNYPSDTKKTLCITLKGKNFYLLLSKADHLTCNTASPYFRIENGYVKCTKTSRLPRLKANNLRAFREAERFIVVRWAKRGRKMRGEKMYKWASKYTIETRLQRDSPYWNSLTMRLQRRRMKTELLAQVLNRATKISNMTSVYKKIRRRFRYVEVTELYKRRKAVSRPARLKNWYTDGNSFRKQFIPVR